MRHIILPKTELNVSALCLGCAELGLQGTEAKAQRLLDAFVEAGGNFFDTARVYSDWIPGERGRSERILGEWLASRKNRRDIVIATKGAHPDLDTMEIPRMSYADIEYDIHKSLDALRIDTLELYYLHRDAPDIPVADILDMLEAFTAQGLIRYYACSNWTPDRMRQAAEYAQARKIKGFVANQALWNVGCYHMRSPEDSSLVIFDREIFDFHRQTGIAAIPYSSQAQGFFSYLHASNPQKRKKARNSNYYSEHNLSLYRVLEQIAGQHKTAVGNIVLAYLLCQPFSVVPLIGCRTPDQLSASLEALKIALSDEQRMIIERAAGSGFPPIE